MTFPITKTADHTVAVGDLMSTLVSSAYLFPTYIVTSDGTAIGAANALYVQPGTGASWAITAASLPLPSGAATSANQTTELASLASIDGKLPALGQALAAASVPVVLTASQLSTLTPLATVAATQSGTWNVGLTGTVALPTGASTEAKQDTGNASLASIDGKITAVNTGAVVVSSSALPSGAATAAKQPAIGTAGTPSADVVSIQGVASGTVVPISDGGGSITVDGSVAVTNAGTFPTQITGDALTALQNMDAHLDVVAIVGAGAGTNAQRVTIANDAILPTVTTVTTCATVTALTGGGVAHDGADSGNPHKIGAKAVAGVSGQTKVAAGDRTDLLAGVDGLLVMQLNCSKEDIVSGVAAITDGSNTSVIAQQGIGIKTYITDIIIANTSATAVTVDIRDGVGGSVKATFPAPANTGGVVHSFKTPIPFTAGTEVCADPSAAVSTVTVTLVGFKSKV